jgi:DNA polymerase-3 subunit epsilon
VGPLPAAGIEETERIAAWLEQPGSRLMELTGDWAWPLHATLDNPSLVSEIGLSSPSPAP